MSQVTKVVIVQALCCAYSHRKEQNVMFIVMQFVVEILTSFLEFIAHLAELFLSAGPVLSVCLSVNQGGTNRNCYTHMFVILHLQTYK